MNAATGESGRATWTRLWLFATAFITGAVVMALEILGSRLLAPVFGNSLFVWGALIGVILAAMSSGYAMGGWLADRYHGGKVLAGLLLLSGGWTFLLSWKGHPVMFQVAEWIQDPRWGPCVAASLLLAPPAFGLSGALPALLRLSIGDMGHLGRHTGRMIAVSTVGSLMGTWGTAFYLLSWLGSMTLVAALGAIQLALGLAWWYGSTSDVAGFKRGLATVLLLGGSAGLGWLAFHPDLVLPAPLYQEDSPYQQLRVRDTDLHRYLILDRTFHAIMWKVQPTELFLPYSHVMVGALALVPEAKRGVILGHGGGSIAKWLARYRPELAVDIVEVDPSVVRAAEQFFAYEHPPQHRVFVKDARAFLHASTEHYDIIWVDVFARHLIPFHLTTREFFTEVRARLAPDGLLVVNLASSSDGADQERTAAVVATLRTEFPDIEMFAVKGMRGAENLIFLTGPAVGGLHAADFADRLQALVAAQRLPREAAGLLSYHRELRWPTGQVLTDDFAPFDLLTGRGTSEKGMPLPAVPSGP